jgi:LmbE family N-acetylglucosaminyl deacetylase
MRQLINPLISLNRLRKALDYQSLIKASRKELKMEIKKAAPKARVLVLSPHPDDDVLGCGGVIQKHLANGSKIRVVYITKGDGESSSAIQKIDEIRQSEAISALKVLGVGDFSFGQLSDGKVTAQTAGQVIKEAIDDFEPELIYAPTEFDDHSDHRETAHGLRWALLHSKKIDPALINLYFYEVWTPLYPNRLITIDLAKKLEAVREHKSQLKNRPYDEAIAGLNKYRGLILGAEEPAEAFLYLPADLWLKIK